MNRPLLLAAALLGLASPLTAEMTPMELGRKLDAKLQSGFPAVYRIEMTGVTKVDPKERQDGIDSLNRQLQAELKKPEASRNAQLVYNLQEDIKRNTTDPTERPLSLFIIGQFISLDQWILTEIRKTDLSSGTTTFYSPGNGVVFRVNNKDKSIIAMSGIRKSLAQNLPYLPQFTIPPITAKDAARFSLAAKKGPLVLTREPVRNLPEGPDAWTIDPKTLDVLGYTQSFGTRTLQQTILQDGTYRYETMHPGSGATVVKLTAKEVKIEKPEEPIDPDFVIPAGYTVEIHNAHDSFQIPSARLGGMKASAVTPEILEALIKPEPVPVIYEPK
jgi:hypothetical protein